MAHEQSVIDAGQTFITENAAPQLKLRELTVIANSAAKETGIQIHRNMKVPESSIIAKVFSRGEESGVAGHENLTTWLHSDGSTLPNVEVFVESSDTSERAIAIVRPLPEPKRNREDAGH